MFAGRLTVLQVALYVAVASMLALALMDRAQVYFALAERSAVEATLNNTRAAIYLRLAQDRLQGRLSRERQWDGGNPFELARVKVQNFSGEFDPAGPLVSISPGAWAFDRRRGELVYRPGHPAGLTIEGGGDLLRFRLSVPEPVALPRLEPVSKYVWEP